MRNFIAAINNGATYAAPAVNGNVQLDSETGFGVPTSFLSNSTAINIAANGGTAQAASIVFGGTFAVGDTVKITIESNRTSKQKFVKAYSVTVDSSMVVASSAATTRINVATAFKVKFEKEINAGLLDYPIGSVSLSTATLVITAKSKAKASLIAYTYTDGAGTLVNTPVTFISSEGQPSDLKAKGIKDSFIDLTSYDTVKVELDVSVAQPFIDSQGIVVKELYLFVKAGRGATVATNINAF